MSHENLKKEIYEKPRKIVALKPETPKGQVPPFMKSGMKPNNDKVDPKKSARRTAIQARLASMSKKGK